MMRRDVHPVEFIGLRPVRTAQLPLPVCGSLIFARPEWLWPSLAVALAVSLLLVVLSRRSAALSILPRWAIGAKIAALVLLALCLAEPLWSSQRVRPGANQFLLLADNSRSLTLKDGASRESRGESLKTLLNEVSAPWHVRLEQDFEVRRYQFDSQAKYVADFGGLTFDGDRSDLGQVLRTLRDRLKDRPVAGVLLFTDGNATDDVVSADWSGLPPVYPVPIGQSSGQRDLAISNVTVTTTSFEDAPVTLQVELTTQGLPAGPVIVRVDDEDGTAVKHEVQTLEAGASGIARIQLRPLKPGVTFYRVRVAPGDNLAAFDRMDAAGEVTLENNSRWLSVDRGAGPYRLLYVSGRPNWEYKFLRRSVASDDQLQVTAMIRIAKKEGKFDFRGREGEAANPLFRGFDRVNEDTERFDQPVIVRLNTKSPEELRDGFPKTAADLYQFHAIIVDDLEAQFFTADQLSLLERFVSERGGGFLMLGGQESFRQGNYQTTAVGRMLPVYLNAPSVEPPASGYRLALTREGWLSPWARLRSTESDEVRQLRERAGIRTLNATSGLKPGATVVAEVTDARGQKLPALVEQRFGQGRAAALLAGDLWRGGLEVTDDQRKSDDLGKAWRQMLRWLIVDVPNRVELKATEDLSSGQPLTRIEARVRDPEFHPQDNASVALTITPPEGGKMVLQAEPSLREPGLYEASVASRPAGIWKASAVVTDPEGQPLGDALTGWVAEPAARELQRIAPNRTLLEAIAKGTGGQIVELDGLERLVEGLPTREAPLTETTTTPLWHHPLVWGLIVLGLCCEWGLRRRRGLP